MDQIQHLLKQTDTNSKIAGLILAINHLKKESKENVTNDLQLIYQSMGRKFLFKLLSSPLFMKNVQQNSTDNIHEAQINTTSITCYQVALSISTAMIRIPSINNDIIAATLPLLSNIMAQITTFLKQNSDKTLKDLIHSIIECAFNMLQYYHEHHKNNPKALIRYYIVSKSNHFNQKNAEDANVFSMAMIFIKYLSFNEEQNNEEQKDELKHIINHNQKAIKIIQFMILNCRNVQNTANNKAFMIAQHIFMKSMVRKYKICQTKLKFEYPQLILSIVYHLFGDSLTDKEIKITDANKKILRECLMELKDICIGSLASRMYVKHRLDVFKMIQMSLLFEKHQWFIIQQSSNVTNVSMSSENVLLFVLSSVCNEIRVTFETNPSWHNDEAANELQYDALNTALNIFETLVTYVVSEEDEIDAWIATFSSKTMHALQQDIHNAIRALFFYITELKYAVFEKTNDGLKQEINAEQDKKTKSEEEKKVDQRMEAYNDKFKALSLDHILNEFSLKLLERILRGITWYLNHDLQTFADEWCAILGFVLHQFKDEYIVVIGNVLSKMLTNVIGKSKEDDKKYKCMIIEQLYAHNYVFDVMIGKYLNSLSLQLSSGYKQELSDLFEIENSFLSVALLVHDLFVFNNDKFISKLFDDDDIYGTGLDGCVLRVLIDMICCVAKEKQEIILPLLVVVIRIINKTPDQKLDVFVKNGIKSHKENLVRIATECQKYEHAWIDDIAMDLVQLKQN